VAELPDDVTQELIQILETIEQVKTQLEGIIGPINR